MPGAAGGLGEFLLRPVHLLRGWLPPADHGLAITGRQRDVVAILGLGQRRVYLAGDILGHLAHLGVGSLARPGRAEVDVVDVTAGPVGQHGDRRRILVFRLQTAVPSGGNTSRSSRPRCVRSPTPPT